MDFADPTEDNFDRPLETQVDEDPLEIKVHIGTFTATDENEEVQPEQIDGKKRQSKSRGSYCLAVGCKNTSKENPEIKFYAFPRKNPKQLKAWVRNVNREGWNRDGSLWEPGERHRVCQDHFVGGKPDPSPLHPDYAPTIFASGDVKPKTKADIMMFQQQAKHSLAKMRPTSGKRSLAKLRPTSGKSCSSESSVHHSISSSECQLTLTLDQVPSSWGSLK